MMLMNNININNFSFTRFDIKIIYTQFISSKNKDKESILY